MAGDSDNALLITGAGFSVGIGHPLTAELLDVGLTLLLAHRQADTRYSEINSVVRLLLEIKRVNRERSARGQDELDLEELMQALWDARAKDPPPGDWGWGENPEHARKHNFGWHEPFGIDAGVLVDGGDPKALFPMVVWVLREILYWCADGTTEEYVRKIDHELGSLVGIITTNYDMLPERLIGAHRAEVIDYGYPPEELLNVVRGTVDKGRIIIEAQRRVHTDQAVPVIKLHGGLNLAYCPSCKKILSFPLRDIGIKDGSHDSAAGWYFAWEGAHRFGRLFHGCTPLPDDQRQYDLRLRPLVAPPMKKKEDLDHWPMLMQLQRSASDVIDRARRVAIIGSALRPSDGQLLGLIGRLRDKEIVLYGHEPDLRRLGELLPESRVDFRGPFLARRVVDLKKSPGVPWGHDPDSKEYGEDNPTPEWIERKERFLALMKELKVKAGVLG